MDSRYLTLKQAAVYFGMNEKTIKMLLSKNKDNLIYQKIARRYIIDKDSLADLIANKSLAY